MNTISPEVKTALVTGTDHGVGFSLAKKLLSRGYFVIAVRIDETEKQIDALQSSYPNQMAIVCADIGDDLDFDEIMRVINVNAIGALRITNALSSLVLNSTEKTIVNISSEAGSIADCERTGWFGYCMSKAANNMQSALVHNNIRKLGGKVFAIHPGHVATYMRGHLDTTAKITPDVSAEGILYVVLDTPHPINSRPLYLDYTGKELPW